MLGPPYHVLIDTNFINFSIQNKIEIVSGMMDCLLSKCRWGYGLRVFFLRNNVFVYTEIHLIHSNRHTVHNRLCYGGNREAWDQVQDSFEVRMGYFV